MKLDKKELKFLLAVMYDSHIISSQHTREDAMTVRKAFMTLESKMIKASEDGRDGRMTNVNDVDLANHIIKKHEKAS